MKAFFTVLVLLCTISSVFASVAPMSGVQVTTSVGSETQLDLAVQNGINHLVYVRGDAVYYNGPAGEELLGTGNNPAIAVGPNGIPQVIFEYDGGVWYTARSGSWSAPVLIVSGPSSDIDVDSNNHAHVIYMTPSVAYCGEREGVAIIDNTAGTWSAPTQIVAGYYCDGSGTYFTSPSLKVDADGKYHVVMEQQGWAGNGRDSWKSVIVATDAAVGTRGSPGTWWNTGVYVPNNAIALTDDGTAYTVYYYGGTPYLGVVSNSGWTESALPAGSSYSIAAHGSRAVVAYVAGGNVMYADVTNLANPTDLGAGKEPVVGVGSTSVGYLATNEAGDDAYLASDAVPVTAEVPEFGMIAALLTIGAGLCVVAMKRK